jgi:hypothetical protein
LGVDSQHLINCWYSEVIGQNFQIDQFDTNHLADFVTGQRTSDKDATTEGSCYVADPVYWYQACHRVTRPRIVNASTQHSSLPRIENVEKT